MWPAAAIGTAGGGHRYAAAAIGTPPSRKGDRSKEVKKNIKINGMAARLRCAKITAETI